MFSDLAAVIAVAQIIIEVIGWGVAGTPVLSAQPRRGVAHRLQGGSGAKLSV